MALSISPAYPVYGEEVTMASDLGDPEVARFEITSVPSTSSVSLGLVVDEAGEPIQTITLDKPGVYGVNVYSYYLFAGAQAYPGDPCGGVRTKLMNVASATLQVGGYSTLAIEPENGHKATLQLTIVGDTIRGAELTNFGSALARIAALDATVIAALSALVDVDVVDADLPFITDVNDICLLATGHMAETHPVHPGNADTTNVLLREPANSIPAAIQRLNDIVAKFANGHMQATTAGGTWHGTDDGENTLQVKAFARSLAEAVVLKADFRERVYSRHRSMGPDTHGGPDGDNEPQPPRELTVAIVAYLDFVANSAPTAPSGENSGAVAAQAGWGFTPR